jgi:hypothetical protein
MYNHFKHLFWSDLRLALQCRAFEWKMISRSVHWRITKRGGDAMNDKPTRRVHWSFWVISAISFVWNAMGVLNYFMQMNPDILADYNEAARAIVEGRPAWATGAFAIAVFGGMLGSLLLLLRRSAALYVFVASLVGVIVTMVHTAAVVNSDIAFGPFEVSGYILVPLAVAAFLVWYAKHAEKKSWIR